MKYRDKMVSLSLVALVLGFFVLPSGEYIVFLFASMVFACIGAFSYEV